MAPKTLQDKIQDLFKFLVPILISCSMPVYKIYNFLLVFGLFSSSRVKLNFSLKALPKAFKVFLENRWNSKDLKPALFFHLVGRGQSNKKLNTLG